MAMRMICHEADNRCITSDSANGSTTGVCKAGTLSAAIADPISAALLEKHFLRKHGPEAYYGQLPG